MRPRSFYAEIYGVDLYDLSALADVSNLRVNRGTLDCEQPQLIFHPVHGDNVSLHSRNRIARRSQSFCKSIAFSNRPISVDECVCMKLTEQSQSWSGVLRFGVTNVNPETFRSEGVPKFVCPDMTNRKDTWAKALPEKYAIPNAIVHFFINEQGEMHYGVNGVQKGMLVSDINTSLPLWVVVDIYGNSVAVEFVDASDFRLHASAAVFQAASSSRSGRRTVSTSGAIAASENVTPPPPPPPNRPAPPRPQQNRSENAEETSTRRHAAATTAAHATSSSLATNPESSEYSPFFFHKNVGRNVRLDRERVRAERSDGEYTGAYVFTYRPVSVAEKVTIIIERIDPHFSGDLAFGITNANPMELSVQQLPDDQDDLLDLPHYWVAIKNVVSSPREGISLTFEMLADGRVTMRRGREGSSHTLAHVDTSQPLYFWWDIYGRVQTLRMAGLYNPAFSPPPQPSSSSSSSSSSVPQIPRAPALRLPPPPLPPPQQQQQNPHQRSTTVGPQRVSLDQVVANSARLPVTSVSADSSRRSSPRQDDRGPPPPLTREPPRSDPVRDLIDFSMPTTSSSASLHSSPSLPSVTPRLAPPLLPPNVPAPTLPAGPPPPLPSRPSTARSPISSPLTGLLSPPPSSTSTATLSAASTGLDEGEEKSECVVCMERRRDCALVPCGHLVMCFACAQDLQSKMNKTCPMCRKPFDWAMRIYT